MINECPEPPPPDSITPWFAGEVLPHEAALRGYLRARFSSQLDLDDVVQEVYLQLWKTHCARKVRHVRGFLFTAARNLAITLIRRRKAAPFAGSSAEFVWMVADDAPCAGERASRRQEIGLLKEAIAELPPRRREILVLRRIQGLSHQEVAERLGIGVHTSEIQVSEGVKQCRAYLIRQGCLEYRS